MLDFDWKTIEHALLYLLDVWHHQIKSQNQTGEERLCVVYYFTAEER